MAYHVTLAQAADYVLGTGNPDLVVHSYPDRHGMSHATAIYGVWHNVNSYWVDVPTGLFFLVSAEHPIAKYGCDGLKAYVNQDNHTGKWYAQMAGYGCSKNYATPKCAIRGMLAEHGCTNVRITEASA